MHCNRGGVLDGGEYLSERCCVSLRDVGERYYDAKVIHELKLGFKRFVSLASVCIAV